jgi:hypothetical protein
VLVFFLFILVGVLILLRNHRRGYFEVREQPGTFFGHGPDSSTGEVLQSLQTKSSPHWTQGDWGAQLHGNTEATLLGYRARAF